MGCFKAFSARSPAIVGQKGDRAKIQYSLAYFQTTALAKGCLVCKYNRFFRVRQLCSEHCLAN